MVIFIQALFLLVWAVDGSLACDSRNVFRAVKKPGFIRPVVLQVVPLLLESSYCS